LAKFAKQPRVARASSLAPSLDADSKDALQILAAAMRAIARDLEGRATRLRADLAPGVRSFHIRRARGARSVKGPVHVLFYRATADLIEIVRVLHERMDPTQHIERPRSSRRRT
jgi:plasmid stabilization system protein ParE